MVTQAKKIAEVISTYQKLQYKYLKDENSRQLALQNIESNVEKYLKKFPDQTLQFILPAFPFKFPIRTIFGYKLKQQNIIDAADYFAIVQLEKFIKELRKVYEPGTIIDILMDSEGFKELEKIPSETVSQYKRELEYVIKKLQLDKNIRLIDYSALNPNEDFLHYQQQVLPTLEDCIKNGRNANENDFLKRYIGLYEYQKKQLQQLLNTDDEHLSEDLLTRKRNIKNRLKMTAKEAAYRHLWHQDTWRQIVSEHFPNHLRLTIHPQHPSSEKVGIYLSDKSNIFAPVPWQGVPLRAITKPQTYIDTIVDYSEILKFDHEIHLQYIFFDRIDLKLPCYLIENLYVDRTNEANIYKHVMSHLYLRRTKGLLSFEY